MNRRLHRAAHTTCGTPEKHRQGTTITLSEAQGFTRNIREASPSLLLRFARSIVRGFGCSAQHDSKGAHGSQIQAGRSESDGYPCRIVV
jgi:hypothetical protein